MRKSPSVGRSTCSRDVSGDATGETPRHVRWRHGLLAVCGEATRAGKGDDGLPGLEPPNDLLRLGGFAALTTIIVTFVVKQEPYKLLSGITHLAHF